MNKYNIVRIKGVKINLCTFRTDEAAVLKSATWVNDENIGYYVGRHYRTNNLAQEQEWAEKTAKNEKEVAFCIVVKDTDEYIGNCSYRLSQDGVNATLGILIGEPSGRNKGYGTEAISLLVNYLFKQVRVHRVGLSLVADNERALRCYTKCGFKECGRMHEYIFANGKYKDMILMEILKNDFC